MFILRISCIEREWACAGSHLQLVEDHLPAPTEEELASASAAGSRRSALGPLPPEYPRPRFRFVLRDLKACALQQFADTLVAHYLTLLRRLSFGDNC